MAELLETGLILMAAGMGTVLVLLAALVAVVHGVSRASRWLEPALPPRPAEPPQPAASAAAPGGNLITVIGAAVAAYRRDTDKR